MPRVKQSAKPAAAPAQHANVAFTAKGVKRAAQSSDTDSDSSSDDARLPPVAPALRVSPEGHDTDSASDDSGSWDHGNLSASDVDEDYDSSDASASSSVSNDSE